MTQLCWRERASTDLSCSVYGYKRILSIEIPSVKGGVASAYFVVGKQIFTTIVLVYCFPISRRKKQKKKAHPSL